ncbi:aspartate dehydrogenase domain-containing protein [Haloechinothrix sp. LS1_15]|uniref:aspartate dehydrogenase domain-containing protein n=1 Tax=Haloechinothrix sp. LS1_15 TaxID=2652248 RepID=UPI0029485F44|nr:aspartate dehydrogenase domain-containing protein [Haloechinothrix sp. LS1_15]MDV6012016.1 DUF108 domain-containing protein [Haloechinothrix sp. LS1_15]
MRIGVIGAGSIGAVVAAKLREGAVPRAELAGISHKDPNPPDGLHAMPFDEMLDTADLVVECAGQQALATLGPRILDAGCDLLIVSVGALADQQLFERLLGAGPGAVHLSTGAIGGLDLLAAAAAMGPLHHVEIVTTKRAGSLIQPWMDDDQARRLRHAAAPVEVMRGPARTVTEAFPASANVAASVALAVRDWDVVEAAVVADPAAERTSHVITAEGAAGHYRFDITNQPSFRTPTSSRVVPYAVLSAIDGLVNPKGVFR